MVTDALQLPQMALSLAPDDGSSISVLDIEVIHGFLK